MEASLQNLLAQRLIWVCYSCIMRAIVPCVDMASFGGAFYAFVSSENVDRLVEVAETIKEVVNTENQPRCE